MHLRVSLPKVQPTEIQPPSQCPLPDRRHPRKRCSGTHFKLHQSACPKPVRDTRYTQVSAQRYRCLKCQRTFRVYPAGVSRDHQSDRLKAVSVLLYILGLSYQGVADLLEALEYPLASSTVYENVQAAGTRARSLRRNWLQRQAGQVKVLGLDFTHVNCAGQDKIVAVATAILQGAPLDFEIVPSESALHAERWIRDLARSLGTEVLVTDDADGLKNVAEALGLKHQVCRAHVNRNVHDLIAVLGTRALEHPDPVPSGLKASADPVDQFLEDLQTVEAVITALPAHGQNQLAQLVERYRYVQPPTQGTKASMWFRLRRLVGDWHENWARLTLFQSWQGERQEKLDGTNNLTEQIIGQRVKERYRTMRGYKREESIRNVSSLVGWLGMAGHASELSRLVMN